ncbi:hypothetical protein M1N79_03770 [Dehalococcoidia bacterium]|nr:hypothetical protein [Dehalococcoidia bacterium]
MKKRWLVISVVVVVAMLGAGALAAFHGNQQVTDYGYGAEGDADVPAEGDVDVAAKPVHRGVPLPLTRAFPISPEHWEAYQELREAMPYLIAQGIPVVDFTVVPEPVHRDPPRRFLRLPIYPERVEAYEKLREARPCMIIQVGLREVRDEYKEPIKAIVEGIEGMEFYFFQAEFTREQMRSWRDNILETFWVWGPRRLPAGIIQVPVSDAASVWRYQKIVVMIVGTDIQPQYIEAVRAVVGNKAPLQFLADGDVHTEAYGKLHDAIPYLNAQGIPVVDFGRHRCTPDPQNITPVMIVLAGLREVRDEYKKPIKAIVEGIEGIEFDFFQADFTGEEIRRWVSEICGTFSRPWDLPPGIIEVPVSGVWSSWRCQRITVRIVGEIQPQYIEAVRALVGDKAPLHFQVGGRLCEYTRYWHEMPVPDEEREKHDIFVHVFEQLFTELDLLNMRIGEVEEFGKGLTPDKMTQVIRVFFDYAVEQGLVMPEEREGLEEEMLQEWLEWRAR